MKTYSPNYAVRISEVKILDLKIILNLYPYMQFFVCSKCKFPPLEVEGEI